MCIRDRIGTVNPQHPALRPSSKPRGDNAAAAPVIAEAGGKRLAVAAFLETVAGQGTAADRLAVELVAMDTATHQAAWTLPLDVPEGVLGQYDARQSATVLDVQGSTAVVAITGDAHGAVLAVDLAARKPLWKQTGFLAAAVTGGQVVGVIPKDNGGAMQRLSALNLTDGRTVWSADADSYETKVGAAGPATVVVSGRDYNSGKDFSRLVDAATGREALGIDGGSGGVRCTYDGRSVTVCTTEGTVFAVDTASTRQLWKLPDDANQRVAPTVTAVWHGLIYGSTKNGPVILDARTGMDRPGSPQVAPSVVNGYAGLVLGDGRGALLAYPTTG